MSVLIFAPGIAVQTTRDLIRDVADRWRAQYGAHPDRLEHAAILERLDALDGETATPEDVEAIIGNKTWTQQSCDCCGRNDSDVWVRLGEPPDYGSATVTVCPACLGKAGTAARAASRSGSRDDA